MPMPARISVKVPRRERKKRKLSKKRRGPDRAVRKVSTRSASGRRRPGGRR